ncbi:hypothetical protein F2Q70_00043462 [Brassica cretica]|uniref:Uncharacterized protein n=1 Tax=Brassica cretica TaxID=69181 RepID=A0A8S9KMP7_BRACR|nr:hypothetical protein F2Q70_00043462 [Brassica cretica]
MKDTDFIYYKRLGACFLVYNHQRHRDIKKDDGEVDDADGNDYGDDNSNSGGDDDGVDDCIDDRDVTMDT